MFHRLCEYILLGLPCLHILGLVQARIKLCSKYSTLSAHMQLNQLHNPACLSISRAASNIS